MAVSHDQCCRRLDSLYDSGTGSGHDGHFQLLRLLEEVGILLLLDDIQLSGRDPRHRNF